MAAPVNLHQICFLLRSELEERMGKMQEQMVGEMQGVVDEAMSRIASRVVD